MSNMIRKIVALLACAALVTTSVAAFAQADSGKHFSVVEAASKENALSIPEIAQKTRTSVVAIETETKVVYNDNNYYSPFDGLFGFGYRSEEHTSALQSL